MDLYSLKGPSEILSLSAKLKSFSKCVEMATICLTNKDYANGELMYGSILADLSIDCFKEALNLNDLDLFSIHSCFAYSSIGADFKSESALNILNSIDKPIKLPLVAYLKAFVHIANDRIGFARDELKSCQTLLDDGYNFKSNHILNEDIVPEINDEFLKLKLNGLRFACELLKAKEDNEDLKRCFRENWLKIGRLCETDFARWDKNNKEDKGKDTTSQKKGKQNKTGAIKKVEKVVKGEKSIPKVVKGDKNTLKATFQSIAIQTAATKGVNVSVQTCEKEISSQILATVIDIRNKMNNMQSKKDTEIKQLQKKNSELTEKLLAKESKRQERSSEFDFMKDHCFALEKKFEESQKQVEFLQKLLVEQLQQKYYMQKNMYKMFEEKCGYKIEYLCEIQKYLQAGNSMLSEECGQEAFLWKKSLDEIVSARNKFDVYYSKIDDLVVARKYSCVSTRDWPGIPLFPSDIQDIIHRNFKIMIQQGKAFTSVTYPNYSAMLGKYRNGMYNSNYFVNNYSIPNQDGRTTGSPPCFTRGTGEIAPRVKEQKPLDRPHSSKKKLNPQPSYSATENIYQSENELLKFLQSNFQDIDELELLEAVYNIRDSNGGSLDKFPKIVLVHEIEQYFKKSRGAKTGWTNVNHVPWHNDHSESKCVICFEDFNLNNSYSLPCQHEFHKKCITNWLKRQSACPVCRVHAVIDEEFPPLKT